MRPVLIFFCIHYLFSLCTCDFTPLVLHGMGARIEDFSYMGFLAIKYKNDDPYSHICGSSILTKTTVLTAGHCLADCNKDSSIFVYVGDALKLSGTKMEITAYMVHRGYDDEKLNNDIAIARVKYPMPFSSKVSKITLMKKPPYYEEAVVAGWGLIDEDTPRYTKLLQYTKQQALTVSECIKVFYNEGSWGAGTFCAGNTKSVASRGDSGSPLVVRGYIQIGLVSYKANQPTNVNKNYVVYTDTGYHYKWIKHSIKHLSRKRSSIKNK